MWIRRWPTTDDGRRDTRYQACSLDVSDDGAIAVAFESYGTVRLPRRTVRSPMTSVVVTKLASDGTPSWITQLPSTKPAGSDATDPTIASVLFDGTGQIVVAVDDSGRLRLTTKSNETAPFNDDPDGPSTFYGSFITWLDAERGTARHSVRDYLYPAELVVTDSHEVAIAGTRLMNELNLGSYEPWLRTFDAGGKETYYTRAGMYGHAHDAAWTKHAIHFATNDIERPQATGLYTVLGTSKERFISTMQFRDVTQARLAGDGGETLILAGTVGPEEGELGPYRFLPRDRGDLVFARLAPSFQHQWAMQIPVTGQATLRDVATVASTGHFAAVGTLEGSTDLGTGPLTAAAAVYVAVFDAEGRTRFAHLITGDAVTVHDIAIDAAGATYLCGRVTDDLSLGDTSSPGKGRAVFVAKLGR